MMHLASPFTKFVDEQKGIRIAYPKSWEVKGDPVTGEVARFVSPLEDGGDEFQESLIVTVEFLESRFSLQDYTDKAVDRISQIFTKEPIIPTDASLAGREAKRIVYKPKPEYGPEGLILQRTQVWTVEGNKAYIVTYTVEQDKSANFEEVMQRMIDSLRIEKK